MAKKKTDEFANVAYAKVTQSAANTLTFEPMQLAIGLFQGIALILHRILYIPTGACLNELGAVTDVLALGIVTSNRLANIYDISDPAVIDYMSLKPQGAPVEIQREPYIHDLSTLPGGGKIVAANPLYLAMDSTGFVAAQDSRVQIDFTFVELADRDYIELIQTQIPANV